MEKGKKALSDAIMAQVDDIELDIDDTNIKLSCCRKRQRRGIKVLRSLLMIDM